MDTVDESELIDPGNEVADFVNARESGSEDLESPQKESIEPSNQKRHFRLPLARIKNMMKMDPDCSLISQDSLFLVAKATEMFIEFMAVEAARNVKHGKRKTVMKRDVESVIESNPNLCFLDGAME